MAQSLATCATVCRRLILVFLPTAGKPDTPTDIRPKAAVVVGLTASAVGFASHLAHLSCAVAFSTLPASQVVALPAQTVGLGCAFAITVIWATLLLVCRLTAAVPTAALVAALAATEAILVLTVFADGIGLSPLFEASAIAVAAASLRPPLWGMLVAGAAAVAAAGQLSAASKATDAVPTFEFPGRTTPTALDAALRAVVAACVAGPLLVAVSSASSAAGEASDGLRLVLDVAAQLNEYNTGSARETLRRANPDYFAAARRATSTGGSAFFSKFRGTTQRGTRASLITRHTTDSGVLTNFKAYIPLARSSGVDVPVMPGGDPAADAADGLSPRSPSIAMRTTANSSPVPPTAESTVVGAAAPAAAARGATVVDSGLVAALAQLVANMERYRPFLPNWLMQADEPDELADEDAAYASMLLDSGMTEAQKDGTNVGSAPRPRNERRLTDPFEHELIHRRPMTVAVLEFWFTAAAEESDRMRAACATALVDALHHFANDSRGAVHSFTLGEVYLSWNSTMRVASMEAKALECLCRLRTAIAGAATVARAVARQPLPSGSLSVKSASLSLSRQLISSASPLANVRFAAAVVTAGGVSQMAGTAQQSLIVESASRVRLRALLRFASAAARRPRVEQPGAADAIEREMHIVADRPTALNSNLCVSAAGFLLCRGIRGQPIGAAAPPRGLVEDSTPGLGALPLLQGTDALGPDGEAAGGDAEDAMERTAGRAEDVVEVYDVVAPRQADGEWIYAMETRVPDLLAAAIKGNSAQLAAQVHARSRVGVAGFGDRCAVLAMEKAVGAAQLMTGAAEFFTRPLMADMMRRLARATASPPAMRAQTLVEIV